MEENKEKNRERERERERENHSRGTYARCHNKTNSKL